MGQAIREGQERGEIAQSPRITGGGPGRRVPDGISSPADYLGTGGQAAHEVYALTDGVTDEQFETRASVRCMNWTEVTGAIAASVSVVAGGWSWWRSHLSAKAKREAEAARDESRRNLQAVERLAEAAERAFPTPPDFAFRAEMLQRGTFRLRNTGARDASNVLFVESETTRLTGVSPRWLHDGDVDIPRGGYADFDASTVSRHPLLMLQTVYPKEVTVACNEHPEPITIEMPVTRAP